MRSNIKLQLSTLTPVTVVALARNVVSKMEENEHFPSPPVALTAITDLVAEVVEAIEVATYGSRQSKLNRNDLVTQLKDLLRTEASYVRGACNGDRTMLESSGFELAKVPEKVGIPGTPLIKKATMTGVEGQVEINWSSQKGAKLYQVWMTESDPADNATWLPVSLSSKSSLKTDDLESYKPYWFCVNAIGAAGEGLKSDPVIARAA